MIEKNHILSLLLDVSESKLSMTLYAEGKPNTREFVELAIAALRRVIEEVKP